MGNPNAFDPQAKVPDTSADVLAPIRDRWSPRSFTAQPVEPEKLRALFEAARWAASSRNQQPWRFVVGQQGDDGVYDKLFDALAEFNQQWATAPVLFLVVGKTHFDPENSGKENWHYAYDTGQAMGQLAVQATALGLHLHQMGGFSRTQVREQLHLPDAYHPIAVVALGYRGNAHDVPDDLLTEELAKRERKPLGELVFAAWEHPFFGG